ncbi:MAG TPA: CHAT domain-containing protein [Pseudonocardiaceae bacterium]|nr:CHAT domain-containing protein [Pseudonocardiaceae bacterium]
MLEYEELRIRVRKVGPGRYLVVANGPAAAADVVNIDLDPAKHRDQLNHLIQMELGREPRGREHVATRLRELGRQVFDLLLCQPIADCVEESQRRTQRQEPVRGLRLRFDLPPELRDLPVEALIAPSADPKQSLGLNYNLSLVRSLPGDPPGGRLPGASTKPDRIHLLVAVASPADDRLSTLDASTELAALRRDLPELTVRQTVLTGATRTGIENWLTEHAQKPAAVLLIAHGAHDEERGEGVVYLEADDGRADAVPAQLLSGMLVQAQQLRLVVLNLCAGGRNDRFEPFAGLAQALIGRGVPAVVAMQDQVTDLAASTFGPMLLRRVSENQTIDQAVTAARQHVANLPGHTAIEWTTPVLFMHEAYRHGWLFKARETHDDGEKVGDPLHDGFRAMERFQGSGHLNTSTLLAAIRYVREQGEWDRLLRMMPARRPSAQQQWLAAEAELELAWPDLERACAVLATDGDPRQAAELLASTGLPVGLLRCLDPEIERADTLAKLTQHGRAAEDRSDWPAALDYYQQVLAVRPHGYRAVRTWHDEAVDQVEVAGLYDAAQADQAAGRWAGAAHTYAMVCRRRPDGYRDADALAAYSAGRAAEEQGQWTRALTAYQRCPEFTDLPNLAGHSALAAGRVAADTGNWAAAMDAFTDAVASGIAADDWLAYATGRDAETAPDNENTADATALRTAIEAYTSIPGFIDASQRLLLITGRLAAAGHDWPAAHQALTELSGQGWDVTEELATAQNGLYDLAADETDWAAAATHFAALPPDYRDAGARARYAAGRAAELTYHWVAAVKSYLDNSYDDAPTRLGYAKARAAEFAGNWWLAGELFVELPGYLFDVADRLLYVAGRDADRGADWPGVIEGFGRLPDDHRDVGGRRRYARAKLAEAKADWGSVLVFLDGLPDDDREGAVGVLRRKATGQVAEAAGDWDRAAVIYAPAAELAVPHHYATARSRELAQDSPGVLAACTELPDDYQDVPTRRGYATARLAEAEDLSTAVSCYAELPTGFSDVAARHGWVKARLAETEERWADALAEAEAAPGFQDMDTIAGYAAGRLAEADEDWAAAAVTYHKAADRADATHRAHYAEARQAESAGEWSAAIDGYRLASAEVGAAAGRMARLVRLRQALPWADGLTSAALMPDPFALRDATFPYLALREVGVTPGSSTEVVRDAAYALMERGGMTFSERVAWDRLRSPAKRLRLDAMLYQFRDPKGLRAELAATTDASRDELLARLAERLPSDAPLLVLLTRGRDEAIAAWTERLVADPTDMALVHSFAVAHLWWARELEESGAWELAFSVWSRALACWAVVLTDEQHWIGWGETRAACYRHAVTAENVAQLRWELGQHLFETLAGYGSRHAEQGRPEQARAYEELSHILDLELEGGRVLAEVGGLPVGPDAVPLACGPGYLNLVRLPDELGRLVGRIEQAARDGDDPGELVQRRLRCMFSELASACTFSERHRLEQALAALPDLAGRTLGEPPEDCAGQAADDTHPVDCPYCMDFRRHNPAYRYLPYRRGRLLQDTVDLAVHTRLAMARRALAGDGGLDRAMAEWTEALRVSDYAAMTARTKQAIQRMVLGRAAALADESGARLGACLDQAILVVRTALPLLGPAAREPLNARLAVLLTDRGVWYGYSCSDYGFPVDMARAEQDLRHALELNPESTRARDNLVRALVFGLPRRPGVTTYHAKLSVLAEALSLLNDGLARAPDRVRFRETLEDLQDSLDALLYGDVSITDLVALISDIGADESEVTGAAVDRAAALAAEAERKTSAGEGAGAARDLVRASRADPANGRIRRLLLAAVRRLIETEVEGSASE